MSSEITTDSGVPAASDAPRVSVVVPTWNRAVRLMDALASIEEQTLTDFECIVVDDGSTDDTQARFAERFGSDARFRILHQENAGPASARNHGVAQAKAEWIAFLDSDDRMHAHRLEAQLEQALSKPKVDMVLSDLRLVGPWHLDGPTVFTSGLYIPPLSIQAMMKGAWGSPCGMLVCREVLEEVPFNGKMRAVEDTEWLFRLLERPREIVIHVAVVGDCINHAKPEGAAQLTSDQPLHRLVQYKLLMRYKDHLPEAYKGAACLSPRRGALPDGPRTGGRGALSQLPLVAARPDEHERVAGALQEPVHEEEAAAGEGSVRVAGDALARGGVGIGGGAGFGVGIGIGIGVGVGARARGLGRR